MHALRDVVSYTAVLDSGTSDVINVNEKLKIPEGENKRKLGCARRRLSVCRMCNCHVKSLNFGSDTFNDIDIKRFTELVAQTTKLL